MRVELREISKSFGPVRANDGISLVVEGGTIHGILGENGAGKSTLMKILSGFLAPDRGQILVDGVPVRVASPADAVRLGIGMLHQDPLDFPTLTLLDNFLLGAPGRVAPDRRRARDQLMALAAEFGFTLNPDVLCGTLTVGERQQLEILRLLWLGVKVLILDEPTTAISPSQRARLFAALRAMARQGRVILFVSHKLEEVQELCDRVTVLRQGRVAGEVSMPCETRHLVHLMYGQPLPPSGRGRAPLGPPVLELVQVTATDGRLTLERVSLVLRAGEVVGLAGLEGSGQRVLLHACAGLLRPRREARGRPHPGPHPGRAHRPPGLPGVRLHRLAHRPRVRHPPHRRVQHPRDAGDPRGRPLRGKPAAGPAGPPPSPPVRAPLGTPHPGARRGVLGGRVAPAPGAPQSGHGHRLLVLGPGRAAGAERPDPRVRGRASRLAPGRPHRLRGEARRAHRGNRPVTPGALASSRRPLRGIASGSLSVVLTLAFGAIVLRALGASPLEAYRLIFAGAFGTPERLSYVLTAWAPLLLCTAGLLMTFRGGLWNIGVEGQVVLGAIAATGLLRGLG